MSTAKERKLLRYRLDNLTLTEQRRIRDTLAGAAHIAAPIFAVANWQWSGETGADDERHVPTEAEIALVLGGLARTALENGGNSFTGRFGVCIEDDLDQDVIGVTVELQMGSLYIDRYEPRESQRLGEDK